MKSIKRLTLIIALGTLMTFNSFAQQQNWNWYFGINAAVNFSSGNPVSLTGAAISAFEGNATISDASGNLLFYTDGIQVWNKLNIQMPNGSGLNGNGSSTQSGVIVPHPNPDSSNIYYIFTCGNNTNIYGICYSEVDMTLDAGLGDVTVKNVQLVTPACEKIVAVKNCDNQSYWVVVHDWGDNGFYAYPVTSGGVGTPVITYIGATYTGTDFAGYIKASPNTRKVASNRYGANTTELYDFDNSTGILSNVITIPFTEPGIYGCSFSPNNEVLYVGCWGSGFIYQYDLSSNNQTTINASQYEVESGASVGALQIASDGKLYISPILSATLSVINNPDVLGVGCNYATNASTVSGTCYGGLPNFIDAFSTPPPATSENINVVSCTDTLILAPTGTGTSYLWSTGATTDSIRVTHDSTYWVHVIGATACTQTVNIADTFNVTFAAHPVVNLGPNHSVCGTGPDTLRAGNPGDTYHWSTGATTDSIYINTTGTYYVSVNNGGCTTTDSVTVTFVAAPTVNLGPDTTICSTNSITLNAGNTGFNFLWNTGATTQTITTDTAGNYFVYVSEGVCHGADTIHISIATPPVVNIGPDTTICSNQSVTLNAANTGDSFLWNTGATSQTITATNAGTYWVRVSNTACSASDTAVITVIQMPVVNLGHDSTLCNGESITINAGNAGYNFVWNTGATTQTINVTTAGHYSVIVNQNLCVASDTIIISFIPPPVINLGNDTIVCSPNPVNLNAQNNGNTYLWNTSQTTQVITVNTPGIYWVIVNNGSCTRADSIIISVVTPPVLVPGFIADTTKGCNPLTINFTNNSTGGTSYIWEYGDSTTNGTTTNVAHTFTDSGLFTITLIMINDTSTVCGNYYDTLIKTAYIAIADPIHITSKFTGSPLSGCTPLTVNLINSSTNGSTYYWNFGNGITFADTGNVEMIYPFQGVYTITLIATNPNARCYNPPDSMSIEVTVDSCNLYVPNTFSPNGDGKNDYFQLNAEGYDSYHLIIFDRWGLKVFESTSKDVLWNGLINNTGSKAPDGTYYYIFTAINPNEQPYSNHGFLTLIR